MNIISASFFNNRLMELFAYLGKDMENALVSTLVISTAISSLAYVGRATMAYKDTHNGNLIVRFNNELSGFEIVATALFYFIDCCVIVGLSNGLAFTLGGVLFYYNVPAIITISIAIWSSFFSLVILASIKQYIPIFFKIFIPKLADKLSTVMTKAFTTMVEGGRLLIETMKEAQQEKKKNKIEQKNGKK